MPIYEPLENNIEASPLIVWKTKIYSMQRMYFMCSLAQETRNKFCSFTGLSFQYQLTDFLMGKIDSKLYSYKIMNSVCTVQCIHNYRDPKI